MGMEVAWDAGRGQKCLRDGRNKKEWTVLGGKLLPTCISLHHSRETDRNALTETAARIQEQKGGIGSRERQEDKPSSRCEGPNTERTRWTERCWRKVSAFPWGLYTDVYQSLSKHAHG